MSTTRIVIAEIEGSDDAVRSLISTFFHVESDRKPGPWPITIAPVPPLPCATAKPAKRKPPMSSKSEAKPEVAMPATSGPRDYGTRDKVIAIIRAHAPIPAGAIIKALPNLPASAIYSVLTAMKKEGALEAVEMEDSVFKGYRFTKGATA